MDIVAAKLDGMLWQNSPHKKILQEMHILHHQKKMLPLCYK